MSEKRRHAIFTERCSAHNVAPCINCGRPIHRHDDEWQIEHERASGLLGKDTNPNCSPSHVQCARDKTHRHDLPRIRKAKAQHEAAKVRVPEERAASSFRKPAGRVYDWKRGRYVAAAAPIS
jgi:hypothetical protein